MHAWIQVLERQEILTQFARSVEYHAFVNS